MQQAKDDVSNMQVERSFNVWNTTLSAEGANGGELLDDASLYLDQAAGLVSLMLSSIEDVDRPEENSQLMINSSLLCSNLYTLLTLISHGQKHVSLGHGLFLKSRTQ